MKKVLIGVLVIFSLFLVSCSPVPVEKQCTSDTDCVAAQCCHSTDTVNKNYAPDCQGVICTQECQPETLDCGQGTIKCLAKGCTVVLNE